MDVVDYMGWIYDGGGLELYRELFRDHPEACDATLDIAESVELIPPLESALVDGQMRFHVPRFVPPEGKDLDTYLGEMVEEVPVST